MRSHETFQHSLSRLAHPASLIALVVLAVNDFVLKPFFPSALSGKLSDFSLLFVLPFLLAAGLAWILPTGWQRRGVPWLAFGISAAGFTLLKAVPAAGTLLANFTGRLGMPLYTLPDPTDLMALAVLPLAAVLWRINLPAPSPKLARVILPLAALLSLADAAAPDMGVTCISAVDGELRTRTFYQSAYISRDGGLTWTRTDGELVVPGCEDQSAQKAEVLLLDSASPVQYRFTPGESIERSTDGGQSYQVEYTFPPFTEPRRAYAEKQLPSNYSFHNGPLMGIEDPLSKNILFAMGMEGVLIRQPDGVYTWAPVDHYVRRSGEKVPWRGYGLLLGGEGYLAIAAFALSFSTLALAGHQKRKLRIVKVVIGWLGFAGSLLFPPALTNGNYGPGIVAMVQIVLGLYALLSLLDDVIALARARSPQVFAAGGFALVPALLFTIPYLLWAAEVLPAYNTATLIAAGLLAGSLLLGLLLTRKTTES